MIGNINLISVLCPDKSATVRLERLEELALKFWHVCVTVVAFTDG